MLDLDGLTERELLEELVVSTERELEDTRNSQKYFQQYTSAAEDLRGSRANRLQITKRLQELSEAQHG
jgi:hypothetical protein